VLSAKFIDVLRWLQWLWNVTQQRKRRFIYARTYSMC